MWKNEKMSGPLGEIFWLTLYAMLSRTNKTEMISIKLYKQEAKLSLE